MPKIAKCEGEVVTKDGTGQSIEYYECEFVLSDDVKTISQARSVIRSGYISEYMRKNVKNFKRVRTMQVVDFGDTEQKVENTDLEKLLIKATELGCVPENIENYKRPDYKEKALKIAIERASKRKPEGQKFKVEDQGMVD